MITAQGCVDLKADIALAANGSGRMTFDYRVPKALEALDLYAGASGGLPFPLDKAILDRRVLRVPGITIPRWSREDSDDEIRISAELRFSDLPTLAEFLKPYGERLQYSTPNGRRELRIALVSGRGASPDAAAWAAASYAAYSIALSVTLPVRAETEGPGTISASGTIARYASPTVDLVRRTEPLTWTIRW